MNDTFDIVEKAGQLRRTSKSEIIVRMVQQTTECAWFIRDYMKIGEFCTLHMSISSCILGAHSREGKRMAKNVGSSRKDQVEKFKSKFDELRRAFQEEGIVEIEIAVLRVVDDLQSVKKDLSELGTLIPQRFLAPSYRFLSHQRTVGSHAVFDERQVQFRESLSSKYSNSHSRQDI